MNNDDDDTPLVTILASLCLLGIAIYWGFAA